MRVALLKDLPDWQSLLPRVEEIFFTASAVQSFTDDAHRARFKARWLGRYLDHCLGSFFVTIAHASLLPPPERGRAGWGSAPAHS